MSVIVNLVALLSLAAVAMTAEFVSQLRKCRVDVKVELDECLKQSLEDLRPTFRTGIRELSLPPLEPMSINSIVFNQGAGAVAVEATFTQVKVTGLSNFTTKFVDADPTAEKLTVSLYVPELDITGQYNLKGQIFFLPVTGSGPFVANFKGVDATGDSQLKVARGGDGVDRLSVTNTNIDFTIRDLNLRLDNLFNGDPVLSRTMNLFLNDNGQEILQDVKPEVTRQLNDLVQKVMNDALSQLPVSSFLHTN
ncbi:protein takeout [Procambarus clarkii]|uniref:protein takeout n=1 Tax=Procambarus clarkii TaxID=6728 RepID=UPI001E671407|nr:protein takeout-like [Procambarus clarkii]